MRSLTVIACLSLSACFPRYPGPLTSPAGTPADSLAAAPPGWADALGDDTLWAPSYYAGREWDRAGDHPRELGDLRGAVLMCHGSLVGVPAPGLLHSRLPDPRLEVRIGVGPDDPPTIATSRRDARVTGLSAPLVDLAVGTHIQARVLQVTRPEATIDVDYAGVFPLRAEHGNNSVECRALSHDEVEAGARADVRRAWRSIVQVRRGRQVDTTLVAVVAGRLGWQDARVRYLARALREAKAAAMPE